VQYAGQPDPRFRGSVRTPSDDEHAALRTAASARRGDDDATAGIGAPRPMTTAAADSVAAGTPPLAARPQ